MSQEVASVSAWNLKREYLAACQVKSKTKSLFTVLFPEADSVLTKEKTNTFSSCGPSNTKKKKKSIFHFLKSIIIFH